MKLKDILQVKGSDVYSIVPAATLEQVVQSLVRQGCGALVVVDPGDSERMVGIITERDILRVCASGEVLAQVEVGNVMTTKVFTGTRASSVAETMGLMTEKRIRHLPVVEDGKLLGLISIGDVVKAQHDQLTAENQYLRHYIQG